MESEYEVVNGVDGPRIRLPNGEMINYVGQFGEVFNTVPDMVPFQHRDFDPWVAASEIKRVFEDAPRTCKSLPAKNLYDRFDDGVGDFYSWQAQIIGDVYLFAGTWPFEFNRKHREYANPNYVHVDALPRPSEGERREWLERHASIGSPVDTAAAHLGLSYEEVVEHPFDYLSHQLDGLARRQNTIALALSWGTPVEVIAHVEGAADRGHVSDEAKRSIEEFAADADIDPSIPDPTYASAFHVK